MANVNQKDLLSLKDLLETGQIAPVIDRRYPLADVAGAISVTAPDPGVPGTYCCGT